MGQKVETILMHFMSRNPLLQRGRSLSPHVVVSVVSDRFAPELAASAMTNWRQTSATQDMPFPLSRARLHFRANSERTDELTMLQHLLRLSVPQRAGVVTNENQRTL